MVITASANTVTARSMRDGQTLWTRTDIHAPISVGDNRLFAVSTSDDRIVALSLLNRARVWSSAPFGKGVLALSADEHIVVAATRMRDGNDYVGTTEAFSAANGRVLWRTRGASGYVFYALDVRPGSVISAFDHYAEPDIDTLQIFSRATGKMLLDASNVLLTGYHGNEVWLRSESPSTGYQPAILERYDATSGSILRRYVYAPEPRRHSNAYVWTFNPFLSNRYVFLDGVGWLYRYDIGVNPENQRPRSFPIEGRVVAVLGESVVTVSDKYITILLPKGPDGYSTHRVGSAVTDNPNMWTVSPEGDIGYTGTRDFVVGVSEQGDVFSSPNGACQAPPLSSEKIMAIANGEALVQCRDSLMLLSTRTNSATIGTSDRHVHE